MTDLSDTKLLALVARLGIGASISHKSLVVKVNRAIVQLMAERDGQGYVYLNPDSGEEYGESHPVESGECPDAEDIRKSTGQEDHLWAALQAEFIRAESAEAALQVAREAHFEEAAKIAERDADWTAFQRASKPDALTGDETNVFAVPEDAFMPTPANVATYRIGIATGRAIAAAIRATAKGTAP